MKDTCSDYGLYALIYDHKNRNHTNTPFFNQGAVKTKRRMGTKVFLLPYNDCEIFSSV